MAPTPHLRIGELGRRVGVSTNVLRAWERRYGLLEPARSRGGFRLYGADDEARVRLMQAHLADGASAAEAARLAIAGQPLPDRPDGGPDTTAPTAAIEQLRESLESFDEVGAHAVIDDLLARFTLDTILRDVLLPYLHGLGERWERGEISVAHEHYASALLRGRLLGLARGWGRGTGPRVLVAGAPGEQHDLGLIAFGLAARARGWCVTFLGADTPVPDVIAVARRLEPELVVVGATMPGRLAASDAELRALSDVAPLALAGAGADSETAGRMGARLLDGDPVAAAEALASPPSGASR